MAKPKFKLWSESLGGNLHQSAITINSDNFWIDWVDVCAMSFSGNYTDVVFKVSPAEYDRLKKEQDDKNRRIEEREKRGESFWS